MSRHPELDPRISRQYSRMYCILYDFDITQPRDRFLEFMREVYSSYGDHSGYAFRILRLADYYEAVDDYLKIYGCQIFEDYFVFMRPIREFESGHTAMFVYPLFQFEKSMAEDGDIPEMLDRFIITASETTLQCLNDVIWYHLLEYICNTSNPRWLSRAGIQFRRHFLRFLDRDRRLPNPRVTIFAQIYGSKLSSEYWIYEKILQYGSNETIERSEDLDL